MGPRPRSAKRRKLPDYLRERKDRRTGRVYYSYVGPDGREYGLGTDRGYAIEQAIDANLRRLSAPPDLWERIQGTGGRRVSDWIPEYLKHLSRRREYAHNTRRNIEGYLRLLDAELGRKEIREVSTSDVAEVFWRLAEVGKNRAANACRARWMDVFRTAESVGWIERGTNPVEVTSTVHAPTQRERLTIDAYRAIHAAAADMDPWLQRAMELALVTAQRREDIARMQFGDASEGHLHVVQGKTGKRVRIPLWLRVEGWSIEDVISRCRDATLSRYMIHHTQPRGNAPPGSSVHKDTISRRFAVARDRTGLEWGSPPTFHEIRSLSLRLHEKTGVNTQSLAGHSDPKTTAVYHDSRGSEWIEVGTQ